MKMILCEKAVDKMSVEEQKLEELWEEFIDNLSCEGFDADLKKYLNAIKYLAEIDISNIDNEEYRKNIDCQIDQIVDFIENYKKNYYEISCSKGFKKNNDKSIPGRDYYYYIADQQVKASVYYVRYLNFLERSQLEDVRKIEIINNLNIYKNFLTCTKLDDSQKERLVDIERECENLINIINNISYSNETSNEDKTNSMDIEEMKHQCIQYLDEIKLSDDIEYKKYMMFNNMMREIRFFGAAYQYLWHWKKEKKTLYRCGNLECENLEKPLDSKEEYIKNMFENCISHMNSPSKSKHSYSENLLLDIYKYLVLTKQEESNKDNTCVHSENQLSITSCLLNNDNTVVFNIIKEADVNSIFVDDASKSFHEFIVGKNLQRYDLPYTVEMYPQSLLGERNDKGTTKGMRDWLLPAYFNSWGIDCNFSKTKVADDKEVITYGKCYSEKVNVDENTNCLYKDFNSGTLFSIILNKEDIIYLLLKIFEQKQKELDDIIETIVTNLSWINKYLTFEECYKNNKEYKIEVKFSKENIIGLQFEVVIEGTHFKENIYFDENNEKISIEKAKKNIKNHIESKIAACLRERYNNICVTKHPKSDFILNTMREDGYCFDLIKKYNEYLIGDEEITMLKYLIFKG
ncbi:hypothetical protein [Clostridium botulinum]|uniref:Uncharacterized protein n=1 Tax=Clostridium botulinum TaxID=1491 RepID=A0A6M0V793_CLOBO|nr:hypothetical protein [Clostridium botulinum]NFF88719.1 hypothetical protein [Clostridium botulinum]NFG11207.1 hypothetical protein [Clostridium botulinum]NFN16112.1 hypothetical protein [Clostridium botulinum]